LVPVSGVFSNLPFMASRSLCPGALKILARLFFGTAGSVFLDLFGAGLVVTEARRWSGAVLGRFFFGFFSFLFGVRLGLAVVCFFLLLAGWAYTLFFHPGRAFGLWGLDRRGRCPRADKRVHLLQPMIPPHSGQIFAGGLRTTLFFFFFSPTGAHFPQPGRGHPRRL